MPSAPAPRLFLIDGYALIYRAFYAMMARPLRTTRGENTSAVWGVVTFLLNLLEQHHPTHIAWVHDSGTSHREQVFPDYKATRVKLDEEMQRDFDRSIERIEALLEGLRIPLITMDGYEADDVIGTLAAQAAARGCPTVIVSGDKDFYQLIAPGISLLNPGRGGRSSIEEQWVDESNAAERLGVPPARVVDYLALVGDSSDNVPGVKGIGDKGARQLIAQFGDLDAILAHAGDVTAKRAREALLQGGATARLSRDLVTIRRDVPITLDLAGLAARPWDHALLRRLFSELEFHTLLPRLEPAADGPVAALEPAPPPVVARREDIAAIVRTIRAAGVAGIATVTSTVDPLRGELIGVALAAPEGAWYFPLAHRSGEGMFAEHDGAVNLPALDHPALAPLRELLADPGVPKVGHDAKRELQALRRAGVVLGGIGYDTMLASFVLEPGKRSYALDAVTTEHLGRVVRAAGDLARTGRDATPVEDLPIPEAGRFAGQAAGAALELRRYLAPRLASLGLADLLERVEVPLIGVLADMEWRGIGIDPSLLADLSRQFGAELQQIEQAVYREAGTEFNINSTPQLRHILFEKLQLPVQKKTKTGASTDADVLQQLADLGFAVPRLLLEYRELSKLKSTYVDVLPLSVNARTGRIHTQFNQTGAATGRLSSSDPNLQNIPVRTPRGEQIRRCFVAAPGCRLVVADYSQIELRLLAHLSDDPVFIGAFERGGDIHRETAAIIFEVPVDRVTGEMRARAKTINFATIYGQGPFALSRQLGITVDQARDFIRRYFERFAGVRRFLDATIERARREGYVETIRGRRRYIPELRDANFNIRSFGERTAMNSPLQGSAADLIKVAMINVARGLRDAAPGSGMVLQVHDELIVEAPEADIAAASAVVKREMEGAAALKVPLVVDIGVGPNWLDAKH